MGTTIEVRVPDIGDFHDIPIIEVLVKPGDTVIREQSVVTLESDKATLEVPSPTAGRVASLKVAPGSRVSQGTLILTLEPLDEQALSRPEPPPAIPHVAISHLDVVAQRTVPTSNRENDVAPLADASTDGPHSISPASAASRIYGSPSIRRLGRELGIDLSVITGSGRGGRIMLEDVYALVRDRSLATPRNNPAPAERAPPTIDFSKFGEVARQPLSRIRRISGASLARNWATIPHVTNFDEADITDLEAFRVKINPELSGNPKITLLSFIAKAVAATLQFAPAFNASLDGDDLVLKKYVNVGVAVDTPGGLFVPVIRDVDQRGITDIARELSAKVTAAQAGKLKAADFEGGCFTISSLGGIGGTGFTPIINAPEIAILGVAKAAIRPRFDGAQFLPRLILPLALSWDHRATDGVAAARFLVHLVTVLEDFRRISL